VANGSPQRGAKIWSLAAPHSLQRQRIKNEYTARVSQPDEGRVRFVDVLTVVPAKTTTSLWAQVSQSHCDPLATLFVRAPAAPNIS
jgi:hypothetical protein